VFSGIGLNVDDIADVLDVLLMKQQQESTEPIPTSRNS